MSGELLFGPDGKRCSCFGCVVNGGAVLVGSSHEHKHSICSLLRRV